MHRMSGTHVRSRFGWLRSPLIGDLGRSASMSALPWMLIGLCVAISLGCHARPGVPISRESPTYSNIVAVADRAIAKTLLLPDGRPEVRWQPAPLNRYAVFYPAGGHKGVS
jgi:hypothetical protein